MPIAYQWTNDVWNKMFFFWFRAFICRYVVYRKKNILITFKKRNKRNNKSSIKKCLNTEQMYPTFHHICQKQSNVCVDINRSAVAMLHFFSISLKNEKKTLNISVHNSNIFLFYKTCQNFSHLFIHLKISI